MLAILVSINGANCIYMTWYICTSPKIGDKISLDHSFRKKLALFWYNEGIDNSIPMLIIKSFYSDIDKIS